MINTPVLVVLFRRTGVAQEIRRRAPIPVEWSHEIRFCTTVLGFEITRMTSTLGLELVGSPLTAEAAQQVTQPVVEEALRAVIARQPLVTTLFGWRADSISLDASDRRATVVDARGARQTVGFEYLIGADGSRSVVREAVGARYVGAPGGRPNVNITFRSDGMRGLLADRPAVHHWVLNPAAPGVVGPLDLDGTWWAIATGTASIADDAEAVALVRALLGADLDVEIIATDPWQARLLLSDSYGRDRAYLVGDAAHQNPPWGGHGFNTGVGDAVNLAWKLAAVLRGWAPPELLDSYEAERRPVAGQTIELAATNMRSLPIELGDPAIMADGPRGKSAREAAATAIALALAKRSEFYSLGLVLGYGYGPDSAVQSPTTDVYRPEVRPGNRLPHQRSTDGRSLFDLLGPEFTVLGRGDLTAPLVEAAVELGVPLCGVDPEAHGFRPVDGVNVVLVRPDQHIAWVGRPTVARVSRSADDRPPADGDESGVRPDERNTMRIANVRGRLGLVDGSLALDVESASGGRFSADPAAVFTRWDEFCAWVTERDVTRDLATATFDASDLGAPSPGARQVFGIGLNHADHAAEADLAVPEQPLVFTKFASSVTGPVTDVELVGDTVDWEAELVVVSGRGGRHIDITDAPARIAGCTVGQDISERTVQWQGQPAQFSVGKSFAGFAPTGPVLVTLDELADPGRLRISCAITDVAGTTTTMQNGSTDQLIFSVPELVSRLSDVVEPLPGDLIFPGTPPGIGAARTPPRFLAAGEVLVTEIEGIGPLTQRFVTAARK